MSYLNDPREMAIRPESGITLEEDNRVETMYHWGAAVFDFCDMSPEEYMKPSTVICQGGGSGGGGTDSGSTSGDTSGSTSGSTSGETSGETEEVDYRFVYYGWAIKKDLDADLQGVVNGLSSSSACELPYPVLVQIDKTDADYGEEYDDDEHYENEQYMEEWDAQYGYYIMLVVPTDKTIVNFAIGDDDANNWANSEYETNFGNVEMNGETYKVLGYRAPSKTNGGGGNYFIGADTIGRKYEAFITLE